MRCMFRRLKERATEPELMDDFTMGGAELREALHHLRRLNRIFGAASPTLHGVRRIWTEAGKPSTFSILDIGSGSGDVNRRILKWADMQGIDVRITLVDITEEACDEARLYYYNEPRVQVMRCDALELPEGSADVVTGTQFIHHFHEHELPEVIASLMKASRLGVVINDIHRHWIPYTAVWITTRLVSNNRYIVNDGPLSVAKGFRAKDWQLIRQSLQMPEMSYSWRPLFRYLVVIRHNNLHSEARS